MKLNKVDIIIGIPSYNEADNIAEVVKQIDIGLQKYFSDRKSVIINIDNNSPDDTKKAFLETNTKTSKIYISTPTGIKGKGNNLKNLFKKIIELKAEAGMIVDADIKSVTPEWPQKLLTPILKKECDFVTPIYFRKKGDGLITKLICRPLLLEVLNKDIEQPIGGDMAFSRKLVQHWLKQKWTKNISQYGIDIFMTTEAIKSGFKICQTNLGKKIHKLSNPKLGPMFIQVTDTLFKQLLKINPVISNEAGPWIKTLYNALKNYEKGQSINQREKIIKDLYSAFSEQSKKYDPKN